MSLRAIIFSFLLTIFSTSGSAAVETCSVSMPGSEHSTDQLLEHARDGQCMLVTVDFDKYACVTMAKSEQNEKVALVYDFHLSFYRMINLVSKVEDFSFERGRRVWQNPKQIVLGVSGDTGEYLFADSTVTCEEIKSFVKTYSEKILPSKK